MSTITTIEASDYQDDSRAVINTNLSNLNTDKFEKSGGDLSGQINFTGTTHAGIKLITLTTAQRDALTAANGMAIYNSTLGLVQVYQSGAWASVSPYDVGDLTWSTRTSKTGWLKCDGTAVSRTTYSDLYTLIGTTYGVGDGSTTFNLPNVAGRVLLGAGAGTKVLTFASRSSNTITVTGSSNLATNEVQTGQAVTYSTSGSVITGLTNSTTYYLIRVAYNQFTLASSRANAAAGTAITLSGDGSGTQTFTITYTTVAVADTGGEQGHTLLTSEIPAHTHTVQFTASGTSYSGGAVAAASTPGESAATGGSGEHNNLPPFLVENLFIKF